MIDGHSLKRNRFSSRDIGIILCAVLVVALAPTTQSFWIDEGTMGLLSRLPTFSDLHAILDRMKGSEALMPLTATYFWALEKIVGDSEWALRCGNLPWLWLGIVCLALVGKRIDWPWLPLLFAIHPVVWYYADEVRPYAIQLGAGCWLVLGFVQLLQSDGKNTIGLWNFGLASAALAREDLAQGKEICWIASRGAGQYYHLPLSTTWPPEPGTASLAIPPKDSEIKPDVIFVSKSDLFDRQGLRYPWIRLPGVIETTPCPSFNLYQIPSGYGN